MRASCIAFVVLAAAAAPALSGPVARGPGPKLMGSHHRNLDRSADELISRDEQLTGVPSPGSHLDNTQPVNPAHKRFADRLIDRDADEDATDPTSQHGPPFGYKRSTDRLIDRDADEDATDPTSQHGPPFGNKRSNDRLIDRDADEDATDPTDKLFGRDKAITARD
ncbi:hypothetical protein EDB85DRAFT_1968768, partial [Lactarius pseudohatsudake]